MAEAAVMEKRQEGFRVRCPPWLDQRVRALAQEADIAPSAMLRELALEALATRGITKQRMLAEWHQAQADALAEE